MNTQTGDAVLVLVKQLESIDDGFEAVLVAITASSELSSTLVTTSKNEASEKVARVLAISESLARDFEAPEARVRALLADTERVFRFIDEIAKLRKRSRYSRSTPRSKRPGPAPRDVRSPSWRTKSGICPTGRRNLRCASKAM